MFRFLEEIVARLAERFDAEVLAASLATLSANVLTAGLTFAIFVAAWLLLRRTLLPLLRRSRLDATSVAFAESTLKYALLAVGGVAAVTELGIHTPSLVASLGVAGLTVGFAARDALSNIISGLFIYWDRPFVIDDIIEVGGHFGRVDRITLRSTRVVTPDGKMLAIPNADMVNKTVASFTNFPHLRLDVPVSVGVREDLDRARRLMLQAVEGDPAYLDAPPPRVAVTALGDYNVTLELRAWLDDERETIARAAELREKVFEALRGAGVEMPFETLSLTPVDVRTAS